MTDWLKRYYSWDENPAFLAGLRGWMAFVLFAVPLTVMFTGAWPWERASGWDGWFVWIFGGWAAVELGYAIIGRGGASVGDARTAPSKADPAKRPTGADRTPPGRVLAKIPIDGGGPRCVALTPDGRYAYVTDHFSGGDLWLIDTRTYQVTTRIPVGESNEYLVISPDGRRVYFTHPYGNCVSVIDTGTNRVSARIDFDDPVTGVAVSPDGRVLYVAHHSRDHEWADWADTVSVVETASNQVTETVSGFSWPTAVAVSPDGSTVYVANRFHDSVSVIDASTNKVIDSARVHGLPRRLAFTPDGQHVYVSNDEKEYGDGVVSVIDTSTKEVTREILVAVHPAGLAITSDGRKAYVAQSINGTLTLIDTPTNSVTARIETGEAYCKDLAITPDGRRAFVPLSSHRAGKSEYYVAVLAL